MVKINERKCQSNLHVKPDCILYRTRSKEDGEKVNTVGAIDHVYMMRKEDFHQLVLSKVAKSEPFSCLVTLGADSIDAGEKTWICEELQAVGIPICYENTAECDRMLEEICKTIASRAVQLQ